MDRHTFLDIPFDEHVVPFPNFAAVLMQHGGRLPDKAALVFSDRSYDYAEILEFCRRFDPIKRDFIFTMQDPQKELLPMLALLYQGIPFGLDFVSGSPATLPGYESRHYIDIDIPYVQPDHPAVILNGQWQFSQYKVLAAMQAVGRVFRLFRPGDACLHLPLASMNALLFAVMAPLYFGKSIRFDLENPAAALMNGKTQYAWCEGNLPVFSDRYEGLLRDAAMLFTAPLPPDAPSFAYYISDADDEAAGLAMIRNARGEILTIPGCDIVRTKEGRYRINGHAVGTAL